MSKPPEISSCQWLTANGYESGIPDEEKCETGPPERRRATHPEILNRLPAYAPEMYFTGLFIMVHSPVFLS